jgi:multiple sugar transport system ATP-binding protein
LGLRPDFLVHEPHAKTDSVGFNGIVTEVEPLGAYSIVTLRSGEAVLRAVIRGVSDIRIDQRIDVAAQPKDAFWFDATGETRLT